MFNKIRKAIGTGKNKKQPTADSPSQPPVEATTTQSTVDTPAPAASSAPAPAPATPAEPSSSQAVPRVISPPAPPSAPVPAPAEAAVAQPPRPSRGPPPVLARFQVPSAAPAPPPRLGDLPPKRDIGEITSKPAGVVTSEGISEDDKETTTVPGGIPHPEGYVPSSSNNNVPKDAQFTSKEPLTIIREMVDQAPAGLFASMVQDINTLASAHLDAAFLMELQELDAKKTCTAAQGAVVHYLAIPIWQALETYQATKYVPKGVTYRKNFYKGDQSNQLIVRTHAELLDGGNARTGSWSAVWTIVSEDVEGATEAIVSGNIHVRAWGYEDTTAHMNCTQLFSPTKVHADSELARGIVEQIAEWEKEVLTCLRTVYDEEMDPTLKKIRRTLPITRTRLKWDLVSQRAVRSRELKTKKNQK